MFKFSDIFYYDETSPSCLRWNIEVRAGKNYNVVIRHQGSVAGSVNNKGYYQVKYKSMFPKVHRVIWSLFNGEIPKGFIVDHLDGDSKNNLISNLALKTIAENSRNCKKNTKNTSGTVGVTLINNKYWRAQWYIDGKIKTKNFSTITYGFNSAKQLAIEAREAAIKQLNEFGHNYTERHGQ
jgi:hypothetical protein